METDLSGPALDRRLRVLLRAASERSRREDRPILASLSQRIPSVDPLTLFGASGADCPDRLLWWQPESGFSLTGIGTAYDVQTSGAHRFSDTALAWNALCSGALIDSGDFPSGPLLMGGFSFDAGQPAGEAWAGYPDGRMVLPHACVAGDRGQWWLTLNSVLHPGTSYEQASAELLDLRRRLMAESPSTSGHHPPCSRPALSELRPSSEWRSEVAAAARAVRRGELGKVVLARALELRGAQPFDSTLALQRLAAGYPTCVVFAVAHAGRCFLGATPERLLKVRDGEVSTTCLAGSYPRGADDDADRQLAGALVADPKERREHGLALDDLVERLSARCVSLELPDSPSVLKLRNVQHLCTPISGRLAPDGSVLQIVEQIHPTPSVGGQPRELALAFIREREGLDRGWYTGAVGWVDHRGEGEFAVAIRAALLNGSQATLFAGCGIVADSDPDREYAESCIKLTPMLTALGAE